MGKLVQALLIKHLTPVLKPFLMDFAKGIVFPALKEAAAKTATPIDDSLVAIAEPIVAKAIDDMKV